VCLNFIGFSDFDITLSIKNGDFIIHLEDYCVLIRNLNFVVEHFDFHITRKKTMSLKLHWLSYITTRITKMSEILFQEKTHSER